LVHYLCKLPCARSVQVARANSVSTESCQSRLPAMTRLGSLPGRSGTTWESVTPPTRMMTSPRRLHPTTTGFPRCTVIPGIRQYQTQTINNKLNTMHYNEDKACRLVIATTAIHDVRYYTVKQNIYKKTYATAY